VEQWVYYDLDPASGDAVEYSLAFTDGVLHGWKTRVHQKVGQALRLGEVPVTAADVPAARRKAGAEVLTAPFAREHGCRGATRARHPRG